MTDPIEATNSEKPEACADSASGPRTDQGKEHVSKNAVKHGFTAKRHFILDSEDAQLFEKQLQSLRDEHGRGAQLDDLTFKMAKANWIIERIETGESDLHAQGLWAHPHLVLMDRYKKTSMKEYRDAFNHLLAHKRQQEARLRRGEKLACETIRLFRKSNGNKGVSKEQLEDFKQALDEAMARKAAQDKNATQAAPTA